MTITSPTGTIGADADAVSYIKHLIDRYNEFASREPSRATKFNHGAVYAAIRREFGCDWKLVSLPRFDALCEYLGKRIARIRVAKSNAAKGRPTVSSFPQYVGKYNK